VALITPRPSLIASGANPVAPAMPFHLKVPPHCERGLILWVMGGLPNSIPQYESRVEIVIVKTKMLYEIYNTPLDRLRQHQGTCCLRSLLIARGRALTALSLLSFLQTCWKPVDLVLLAPIGAGPCAAAKSAFDKPSNSKQSQVGPRSDRTLRCCHAPVFPQARPLSSAWPWVAGGCGGPRTGLCIQGARRRRCGGVCPLSPLS